jgi:hypothetical protein
VFITLPKEPSSVIIYLVEDVLGTSTKASINIVKLVKTELIKTRLPPTACYTYTEVLNVAKDPSVAFEFFHMLIL